MLYLSVYRYTGGQQVEIYMKSILCTHTYRGKAAANSSRACCAIYKYIK